jgi:UDP-N-acetylglucosamine acyltransferase
MAAGHCEIADDVFMSAMAALHQYVRVGRGALVSGGSMVPTDVAPFCIAQGDRAVLHGLNVIGLRRKGYGRASVQALKAAYKAVFGSKLLLADALKEPALHVDDPAVNTFREFLSVPKRGFVRPAVNSNADAEPEEVAL